MSILVGVDAGGTKTVAAVAREGKELARETGPAGTVRPGRVLASATAISSTVRQALARISEIRADRLVVGAAGVGREEERNALHAALRAEGLAPQVRITTDIEIALEDGFSKGPGIVLLAGTGSFAIGRHGDGSLHRQGGYGWQMSDEGSGYALGRSALHAVGRARDGRGPATELTAAVLRTARSQHFDELVRWSVTALPTEVAGLATAVLEVAREGDAVAEGLLQQAVRDLVSLVTPLLPGFQGNLPEVAIAGGLLDNEPLRTLAREALRAQGVKMMERTLDPVTGALALARE
ncbi:MAG TPA: BadF/BadG/BcrA/BcrD ATPase family protein [Gemmatimonadales bacterium]